MPFLGPHADNLCIAAASAVLEVPGKLTEFQPMELSMMLCLGIRGVCLKGKYINPVNSVSNEKKHTGCFGVIYRGLYYSVIYVTYVGIIINHAL